MKKIGHVKDAMTEYYQGDVKRINHFMKVYGFVKSIREMEEIDEVILEQLEVAVLLHDTEIKVSEEKY